MAEFDPNSPDRPSVGDEILVPVHQGAVRTTLFPDQVVAVTSPDFVELVLLREEFVVRAQRGVVIGTSDQEVEIEFTPHSFRPEHFDIGHVRLKRSIAFDTAMTIIMQQIEAGLISHDDVLQRLRTASVTGKL
ncbi:hypothetical protein D3C71_1385610 [compost metagenome]